MREIHWSAGVNLAAGSSPMFVGFNFFVYFLKKLHKLTLVSIVVFLTPLVCILVQL